MSKLTPGREICKFQSNSSVSLDKHLHTSPLATAPLIALFQTIKPFICFPNLAAPSTVAEEGDEELN